MIKNKFFKIENYFFLCMIFYGLLCRYFIILLIMANLLFLNNISNNLSKLKIIKFMNNFIVLTVPHINAFSLYSLVKFFYFK
jgi:hypothetical protein